ncbi:TetR/AcrR family transcriptional regulator [Rhodococcus rhodochrous]|uniref:TetR/AcrR family transcriptional regulator n=1 Tax=Rhodococcus rhodochrous TaxID=1829 RepID=UPI00132ECC09|nr:TetR/AcrR family transcriptional regulator [Rhodococcus rhodochrous]QHG80810.1 TetR/AcrR family transcriptional regulator [Rhodococcus rhodochrous]QOH55179.1 TetR/AcrR family transcriptional regulator [Rhodococcus rhodochrous]
MRAKLTRAEQKQATRDALVEAARVLFVDAGYTATTAEAIAKAAGVSRATFYLHFRSKAEIVQSHMAALEDPIAEAYARLDAIVDPALDDVVAWLEDHAEFWREHRPEFASMEQALSHEALVSDEWFAMLRRVAEGMRNLLGRQSDPDARRRARLHVTSMLMSTDRNFHFALVQGHDENFRELVSVLAEQWLFCLQRVG